MRYDVEFTTRSLKDLRALDRPSAVRMLRKIEELRNGLTGDVKALTAFGYGFRLRVGDYRVLFDIEQREDEERTIVRVIVVQRVLHRREAYR
jgi:mRNA interferase RelE/StbE